jgi:transcriptional regulator with XRE-family HTH domain
MTTKEKALAKFGAHLRKLRESKGISLHELAATAALEYSQVQKIEKGKVNLTLMSILALADGLEVSPDTLLKY